MGTVAVLDISRPELSEMLYSRHRQSLDIQNDKGFKNLLKVWPHTGTMTLAPINFTTDFGRSGKWEALKFRLTDVNYQADWWREQPILHAADDGLHVDHYFRCVVKNTNVPGKEVYTKTGILVQMPDMEGAPEPAPLPNEEAYSLSVLSSKADFPANQGYMIKFWMEGRPEFNDAGLLVFYFGDYAVRLSGDGTATLHQATDSTLQKYVLVYSFLWVKDSQIHDRVHTLTIFPHRRNAIEFLVRTSMSWNPLDVFDLYRRGVNGGGAYVLPYDPIPDGNGGFEITQAGKWYLRVSRRFRPHIQISRLAFFSGLDGVAGFFDSPEDLSYAPLMPLSGGIDYDANGGLITWNVMNADIPGQPFVSDGFAETAQFFAQFTGIGDIACKGGQASTFSPEFYSYTLIKPAGFTTVERTPLVVPVLSVKIDQGDAPEGESLTITLDNSLSQVDMFARRAWIPLLLMDDETGVVFFEGTGRNIVSEESPGTHPRAVTINALGMAESLLRQEWVGFFFFGSDPDPTSAGQGYFWGNALRRSFNAGRFDDVTQLVIEEEDLYNFRLWTEGGGGGPSGGSGVSGGHEQGASSGDKMTPTPHAPVYQWINWFTRDFLGWHWSWDRRDHKWHVYKRPRPDNANDVQAGKFNPKIALYSSPEALFADQGPPAQGVRRGEGGPRLSDGIPCYTHSGHYTESEHPQATTVVGIATLSESRLRTKTELQAILATLKNGEAVPDDTLTITEPRRVECPVTNAFAVAGPQTHPDFIGTLHMRQINLPMVTSREMFAWIMRRTFDDLCHAILWGYFIVDWGDANTAYLRKYDYLWADTGRDPVTNEPNYTMEKWCIDRIEPQWTHDTVNRARLRCSLYRPDAPAPY